MSLIWYIYGAGGLGNETMDILKREIELKKINNHECVFIDDNLNKEEIFGSKVTRLENCVLNSKVTIAVGEPEVRELLSIKCKEKGLRLTTIVSSYSFISKSVSLGDGVIVAPFVSIQADAVVSSNVAINTQAIIGHNCSILDHSVISSQVNLGGASIVGQKSYLGMAAIVREKVLVGNSSIVGMGSVVYKDVPDEVIAVGNPSRVSRRNENKKVFK
jgi:sugar O-acyltransferase (sialic acid O-acetyltransferase NeuD family)